MATMADFDLLCGPCQYNGLTKHASKWCTDCEEGFCNECVRIHNGTNLSRNHHVIKAEDYQKTKDYKVNLQCTDHGKQLDFYCATHDSVACVECVQLNHSSCKDLRPLDEVAKGAKTSTAYTDLNQTIDGLLENMEKGLKHLQQNNTNLKGQEDVIKKSIAEKRTEMNKHLDLLEEKLLKELKSKLEKALAEISLMTTKFETKRKHISGFKDTAQNMKQFSSNLQVFVGIRSLMNTAVNEINEIKLLLSSIPQIGIVVQYNPKFVNFTETFDSVGEIQIKSKEAVPYVERGLIQAQYQRPAEPEVHKLDNLQLKLRTNIKMGKKDSQVMSCLILPNKSIMIASFNKPSLTILKEDGSHDRDISVPYNPFDITKIDDQRVAVTYGYGKPFITIANLNTLNKKTLENICKETIYCLTYNNGKLYVAAVEEGIKVIDLDGNIIKTIRIYNDAVGTFKVTTQEDKMYFSVRPRSVHCVNIEGTEIWTCQDDRLHSADSPAIAVDNYGITFTAGSISNLLLAISPDGKQQKVLLTGSDGLQYPTAMCYDKGSKRILVCNKENGHAALYDVIY